MHIIIIPSELFLPKIAPLSGIFQMHQARALLNAGWTVTVISVALLPAGYIHQDMLPATELFSKKLRVIRRWVKTPIPTRLLPRFLKLRLEMSLIKREFDRYCAVYGTPDFIHAHNFFEAGRLSLYLKMRFKVPVIISEHSSELIRVNPASRMASSIVEMAGQANLVLAVSEFQRNLLDLKFSLPKMKVLHNVVDPSFTTAPIPEGDKGCKRFCFVTIGALVKGKNVSTIITALSKLTRSFDAELLVVGRGPELNALDGLVNSLGLDERVSFIGEIGLEELKSVLQAADCLVQGSLFETFGVTLIEAMALGVPVVAYRTGIAEQIINSNNGILVDENTADNFTEAMRSVIVHFEKFNRRGIAEKCRSDFGEGAFVESLSGYAAEVCNEI